MDFDNVLKSVTIREFDTSFTAPLFGYDSVDHYYEHAAPNKKVIHMILFFFDEYFVTVFLIGPENTCSNAMLKRR